MASENKEKKESQSKVRDMRDLPATDVRSRICRNGNPLRKTGSADPMQRSYPRPINET
jgi:hypothetical protein